MSSRRQNNSNNAKPNIAPKTNSSEAKDWFRFDWNLLGEQKSLMKKKIRINYYTQIKPSHLPLVSNFLYEEILPVLIQFPIISACLLLLGILCLLPSTVVRGETRVKKGFRSRS